MKSRFLGIDMGAETVKVVTVEKHGTSFSLRDALRHKHHEQPHAALAEMLSQVGYGEANGVAATGRLQRVVNADGVPTKAALRRGVRVVHPELPTVTVISVGAHGFCVLELRDNGEEWFQQNSRCSQGTGNFLTQLVERFGLNVEEASELCDFVAQPAPLSGRCPVILKTDMTHLANKGEDKGRILAGLYDAVCENVVTLVRPRLSPPNVVLVGGVTRSARVRRTIEAWLADRGMKLVPPRKEDEFLEAIGAAMHAAENPRPLPRYDLLFAANHGTELERVPPLRDSLPRVHRRPKQDYTGAFGQERRVYVGLDIGSTGSKAVAVDAQSGETVWETYLNTEGSPVGAAQRLFDRWIEGVGSKGHIVGVGITGSGREVVGSLLTTCYGRERVFIMNEIAAHARGAVSIDPQVDTIFEIGGQDAKYIRLEGGRVIDAAMNEACSAGTGSFIAEQGAKFEGVRDVVHMGELALSAKHGVSLGQHCSVFMAEIIDEAITQGEDKSAIIAGLYDSIIQNYLNRVKGSRSVGEHIFCQGMPFASDALAAAVTRQTGREVVVPPNPGTIGALGIALLSREELVLRGGATEEVSPSVFLEAKVVAKETFVCNSTKGCGGGGNHCRIDRLKTMVGDKLQSFLWGGNCSLYDKGTGRAKLPDFAPDPFRQREQLLDALIARETIPSGTASHPRRVIGMTDEFSLKTLAPFFIVFLSRLGFRCEVLRHATADTLHKGIEGARIPYCAPAQLYHGVFFELERLRPDYLLLPMVQELPRIADEEHANLCPIVQASPDLVGSLLESGPKAPKILRPILRFGAGGYTSKAFTAGMRKLAEDLGQEAAFRDAFREAVLAQEGFERATLEIGAKALQYCNEKAVVPVVVLGRPYTIHNDVLNSNVPTILRNLGAMGIPIDCLPVPAETVVYNDQYWAYTQRNLRAAEYVRKTPGLYSVFCSNYACGPDSFTLHFFAYIMQGKPFAVVETDGHSGDAGTKTRMEAFLFCVDTDRKSRAADQNPIYDFKEVEDRKVPMSKVRESGDLILIPRMGEGAEVAAAALRSEGYRAETLRMSNREDVRTGRRYTSGKECVPMVLTAGTMLNRLEESRGTDERFVFFMPTASGPCRFGVYNTLHKIILDRAGWSDRVQIVSPDDGDYFRGMSPDFSVRLWVGFCAFDLLDAMMYDVRPIEKEVGASKRIRERYAAAILEKMEQAGRGTPWKAVRELCSGMWGMRPLLLRAAKEFAALADRSREADIPTVAVVGEIYARLDPFANDFIVEKLEARGLRVRFAPFIEWLEYTAFLAEERVKDQQLRRDDNPIAIALTGAIQRATLESLYSIGREELGWGPRPTVPESISAVDGFLNPALTGEACLTLGGPIHEFEEGLIEGVVIVGPHECMPCKVAEAQYGKVAETKSLPFLSVPFNGDPVDTEALDRFAYDIVQAHRRPRGASRQSYAPPLDPRGRPASPTFGTTPLVALRRSKNGAVLGESIN